MPAPIGSRCGWRRTAAAARAACGVCKPGARIEISNPASLLEIDWTRKNYCLIAGGIGITPITGIAAALRRRNIDAPLHYAVKSRGDAAFLDELSALLGDRLIVHASDEGARLDLEATFRALPDDAIAIMCGPMRMLEAARRAWNDAGERPPICAMRLLAPAA